MRLAEICSTRLINSIKHEHSCKILYVSRQFSIITDAMCFSVGSALAPLVNILAISQLANGFLVLLSQQPTFLY